MNTAIIPQKKIYLWISSGKMTDGSLSLHNADNYVERYTVFLCTTIFPYLFSHKACTELCIFPNILSQSEQHQMYKSQK